MAESKVRAYNLNEYISNESKGPGSGNLTRFVCKQDTVRIGSFKEYFRKLKLIRK